MRWFGASEMLRSGEESFREGGKARSLRHTILLSIKGLLDWLVGCAGRGWLLGVSGVDRMWGWWCAGNGVTNG